MKLGQAFQQRTESLFQWFKRLNMIEESIFKLDVCGRKSLEPRLVSKFCFAAWDRDAGVKAMEEGPPKTLEEAVESVRRYQRVQVEAYNNRAKRPHANVRGWSPEREEIDSWDHYCSRRGDKGSQLYNCYRGNFQTAQSYAAHRSQSSEFRKYEDTPRTGGFHDCERARDNRVSYHVRAVAGGLEPAIAELTK